MGIGIWRESVVLIGDFLFFWFSNVFGGGGRGGKQIYDHNMTGELGACRRRTSYTANTETIYSSLFVGSLRVYPPLLPDSAAIFQRLRIPFTIVAG